MRSGPYASLISWARSGQALISFYAAVLYASCRLVGVCFVAAASNLVTRINFEKICQIADAPAWTGKGRWKTARNWQVRRFRATPRRCIRLPPKRLPPKASVRAEFCRAYRCSSASDGKSSCLCLNNVHVRFGSKADICSAKGMSALPPKADIQHRLFNVCRKIPIIDLDLVRAINFCFLHPIVPPPNQNKYPTYCYFPPRSRPRRGADAMCHAVQHCCRDCRLP